MISMYLIFPLRKLCLQELCNLSRGEVEWYCVKPQIEVLSCDHWAFHMRQPEMMYADVSAKMTDREKLAFST